MKKGYMVIGAYGQVQLKEELLSHLQIKPGQIINYKQLPGNKLLLEGIPLEESGGHHLSGYDDYYELAEDTGEASTDNYLNTLQYSFGTSMRLH